MLRSDASPQEDPSAERVRQWGAEAPRQPLAAMSEPASTAATWIGGFAIVATVGLWLAYLRRTILSNLLDGTNIDSRYLTQSVAYVLIMTLVTFSALMYLLARQGAMYRSRAHHRVPRAELDAHFLHSKSSATVLIPSYREDPAVVRNTLLSAALQEFPGLRVVLLIDDPADPQNAEAADALRDCRALPQQIAALLEGPRARCTNLVAESELETLSGGAASSDTVRKVALTYVWAADWLDAEAIAYPRTDGTEVFVAEQVLGALAADLRETASALFAALDQRGDVPAERALQLAQRLRWIFTAELTSFERKTFAHLPHDANKAMNLNAYLGLMGGQYKVVDTRLGKVLRETSDTPDLEVPTTDYVLTLDADSVLLRDYCLRLAYHLETPGNERVAVIQTPYSAFRGAPTRLERIAGATTDTQFIVHQGLTYFGATFWVGANALIRWEALKDLEEVEYVDGYPVRRYVQDRTVIEDTESSIDLIARNWTLHNYPERLSYSATPPDFGSLVIQRARWANGGLLILPKLLRHVRAERTAGRRVHLSQMLLRMNYMASIAWASTGLVMLLAFPFDNRLLSPIILAAAVPYFTAMAYDFHRMGYKRTDVFRVYAFNLILVPVNLAGTFKSLQQAASKSKIPFARTPKVHNRTAAPAGFIIGAVAIALYSLYTLARDVHFGRWNNAFFAGVNTVLSLYAIIAFIGIRNAVHDVWLGVNAWVRVPVKQVQPVDDETSDLDWETALYYGPGVPQTGAPARRRATAPQSRPRGGGERRSRVRTEVAK